MKQWIKKAAVATVVVGGAVVAQAQTGDSNVSAVTAGVSTLTTVFGTVFALGVAVVILSDGRVPYFAKRQVMFIDENRCVVDGAWVYKKVNAPAPFPVAAAVATPSESRSPSPVTASRSVIPERRTRTMTIHFADGSAFTKQVEPTIQTQTGEPVSSLEESSDPVEAANYPPGLPNRARNPLGQWSKPR